jgi:hypothetical protein
MKLLSVKFSLVCCYLILFNANYPQYPILEHATPFLPLCNSPILKCRRNSRQNSTIDSVYLKMYIHKLSTYENNCVPRSDICRQGNQLSWVRMRVMLVLKTTTHFYKFEKVPESVMQFHLAFSKKPKLCNYT